MPRALILGGTGLVGRAIARRLLTSGWQVDLTGRSPDRMPVDIADAGGQFVAADRSDPAQLRAALGEGADLLVDCICYTAADARQLVPLAADSASTVMISSKAVYVDDEGRHSNSDRPPVFATPVSETQPTLPPGDMPYDSHDGYGPNKVAAEQVLLDSGHPVTVLRPSKVHGQGALRPREWVFAKRALDRRPAVLLAHRGVGAEHPTSTTNMAALVEVVAGQPGARILNSADPDVPNGLEIARTVARLLGHRWDEVLLDDDAPESLGAHPWDTRPPFVLDLTAAADLGYVPVGDFATTLADEVSWLASIAAGVGDEGGAQLPADLDREFFDGSFDYAAEDAYLSSRPAG